MIFTPRKNIWTSSRNWGNSKYQKGILHPVGFWAEVASGFNPTNNGRVEANGDVIYALGDDLQSGSNASATGHAGIWLTKTSDNCYLRVGGDATGNITATATWYNTSGGGNTAASRVGSGTTVFTLGEVPDSVIITNVSDNTQSGSPTFTNINGGTSYTSGSSFSPTTDAKYGREVQNVAATFGPGSNTSEGNFDIRFTFEKSGYDDYVITYQGHGKAIATEI